MSISKPGEIAETSRVIMYTARTRLSLKHFVLMEQLAHELRCASFMAEPKCFDIIIQHNDSFAKFLLV